MKAHTLVIPPRFKYDPSALLPLLVSPSSPPSPGLNGPLRKPIISSQGRFTKSFSSWPWPNMQSEAAPELSDSLSCFAPRLLVEVDLPRSQEPPPPPGPASASHQEGVSPQQAQDLALFWPPAPAALFHLEHRGERAKAGKSLACAMLFPWEVDQPTDNPFPAVCSPSPATEVSRVEGSLVQENWDLAPPVQQVG